MQKSIYHLNKIQLKFSCLNNFQPTLAASYILKVVLLVSEISFFLGGSEHEMFSSSFTAQIDRSTLSFDTMPSMSG